MRLQARLLIPGLLVPGGGYMVLRAWRQGLAFLSIGLLVVALWTDMFTQFRFGALLFWAVLCLAAILGADEVSRQSLGQGLGIAWIINGSAIYVATGLALGYLLSLSGLLDTSTDVVDMVMARQVLVAGELAAYALGGLLIGAFAPRPVRTAAWGALLAIGWSLVRGMSDIGVEQAMATVRTRLPQLGVLYGASLFAAAGCAFVVRLALQRGSGQAPPVERVGMPPPVTPPREVMTRGPRQAGGT